MCAHSNEEESPMLIWGFKTLFKTLSEGVFFCPQCGGDRSYQLKLARRWFTLFFIPVFTYKQDGVHVECQVCKGTFAETALQRQTNAAMALGKRDAMRAVAFSILRTAGTPSAAARAKAAEAISSVVSSAGAYTVAELDAEWATAHIDLEGTLVPLGDAMQGGGREWLLSWAVAIASVDGEVSAAERALLDRIGALLQMSSAHVAGVVATAQRGARA
ncbi:MAG TPA: zinc ribbon domain-containing protein [Yinghuangia sp.]|nr:zinc ribbon domain-containing protein [Yinghuangia sp.]